MASTLNMYRDPVSGRVSVYLSGTYTAATEANSSGPSQTFSGSTVSTRALAANALDTQGASIASGVLTITPGFMPSKVEVKNVTDKLIQTWHVGMNTGDFIEEAAAGDKTLETDDKVSVNATTGVVTVTADGGAITDNDTVVVEIFR